MGQKRKQAAALPAFIDPPGPLAPIEDWISIAGGWIGSRLNFV